MKRHVCQVALLAIFLLAILARLVAWHYGSLLHPDAYFQYVDPAWRKIAGVGFRTWEWNDGMRSWVLPAYHGGWIALLAKMGVRGSVIGEALRLHWVLLSLLMVWAAWRGGASLGRRLVVRAKWGRRVILEDSDDVVPGWLSGLLAAFLVALFPLLSIYANQTLAELPSMIGLVYGFALTAELVERRGLGSSWKAAWIGVVVSLSVCFRVVNVPLALLLPIWMLLSKQRRQVVALGLGALLPIALFGLVDYLTWGQYWASFFNHIKFNIVEGRATQFGTAPPLWYWELARERAPIGLWWLLVLALAGWRVTWPFVVGSAGMLALMSSQAHKEERFMILCWPLLLIAAGAVAGAVLSRLVSGCKSWPGRWQRMLGLLGANVVLASTVYVVAEAALHTEQHEYHMLRGRYDAQAFLDRLPGVSGVLVDWTYGTGGFLWLGKTVPQVEYRSGLLSNAIFSHVISPVGSDPANAARAAGFVEIFEQDGVAVLERTDVSHSGAFGEK